MTLNKREYLKQAFSYKLAHETGKMIAARRDFLAGNARATVNNTLAHRQELFWQLQEFRYEFWDLSAKERESKIDELSKQAPAEFKISLEHLQQVGGLEEDVKKLENDLDFDPLLVERFKSRLLWKDDAVPHVLELRTAIPAKTYADFKRIQGSVPTLREKYPQLARLVPQWLEMIETSEVVLDESAASRHRGTPRHSSQYVDPSDQAVEEFIRTEIETNRQPDRADKAVEVAEEEEAGGCITAFRYWIIFYLVVKLLRFFLATMID